MTGKHLPMTFAALCANANANAVDAAERQDKPVAMTTKRPLMINQRGVLHARVAVLWSPGMQKSDRVHVPPPPPPPTTNDLEYLRVPHLRLTGPAPFGCQNGRSSTSFQ